MTKHTKPSPSISALAKAVALATAPPERMRRRGGGSAEQPPGAVIPGESFHEKEIPTGGERFQLVSRGGKGYMVAHPLPSDDSHPQGAITDFLNCTLPFPKPDLALSPFFAALTGIVPALANPRNRGRGLNGYEMSFDLGNHGAKFAVGGQRGTALLMLPGAACHTVPDWVALTEFLRDHHRARITRWDGAIDDYEGTHSIDWAVGMYMAGHFCNGGNKPSCSQRGNWIEPDGSGRTFYVGKRENGKLLRVYEKGMQLGSPDDPWVRWEIELHNVDRVIPWDVLTEPGRYLAGSFPKVLGWVQEPMSRIATLQNEAKLSYAHLVHYAATAYGPLLNVMMEVEPSAEAVVDRLRRDSVPRRLHLPIEPTPG